jgi:hypothetical protein
MPIGSQHGYLRGESGDIQSITVDQVLGKIRNMLSL